MNTEYTKTKRRLLKWKPFPLHVFPKPLAEYIAAEANAKSVDPSMIALPMLSILSSSIGNSRRIGLGEGYTPPPATIWTAVVVNSGETKSPAFSLVLKPMHDLQAEAIQEFNEEMKQFEVDLAEWKAASKGSKKTPAAVPASPPPDPPQLRHIYMSDITTEAVGARLQTTPRGLLIECDELAAFFKSFNQYKKGGTDREAFLSMYDARCVKIDRKTSVPPTIFVRNAFVAITGGVQPEILRGLLNQEMHSSGMVPRFIFVFPPTYPKKWPIPGVSEAMPKRYAETVLRLRTLQMQSDDSGVKPALIPATSDAQEVFGEWFLRTHNTERRMMTDERLQAAYAKLADYAAKFALVLHLAAWACESGHINPDVVDQSSMSAGIELAEWCKHETQRVYEMLAEDDIDADHRKKIAVIRNKGGEVSVRDWQRIQQHSTASEAKAELKSLVDAGYGRLEFRQHPNGGKPSEVFVLDDHASVTEDDDSSAPDGGTADNTADFDCATPGTVICQKIEGCENGVRGQPHQRGEK